MLLGSWLRPNHTFRRKLKHWGLQRYCPACESRTRRFEPYGSPPRPDAACPVCSSSERERAQVLLLRRFILPRLANISPLRVLHIAPENGVARVLAGAPHVVYVSGDIELGRAMERTDLTNLRFADGSIDFIFLSHVLEHIEDDARALAELYRVLAEKGRVFIEVPVLADKTFEDFSLRTAEQRLLAFGQTDHVRICGLDYRERIERARFDVEPFWIETQFTEAERARMRLSAEKPRDSSGLPRHFESVRQVSWLCSKRA